MVQPSTLITQFPLDRKAKDEYNLSIMTNKPEKWELLSESGLLSVWQIGIDSEAGEAIGHYTDELDAALVRERGQVIWSGRDLIVGQLGLDTVIVADYAGPTAVKVDDFLPTFFGEPCTR